MTAAAIAEEPEFRGDGALTTLAMGSKTFAFAGWFLPADRRADAALLYTFCRYVDDIGDDSADLTAAREELTRVQRELLGAEARPLVAALLAMFARRGVKPEYAVELVHGVLSDLDGVRVADDAELLRYCYRVASTVGLMMCGVLGVSDPVALPHAIDLGLAMQLTNICRDVKEDAKNGRIYLPSSRMKVAGFVGGPGELLTAREPVRRVVADLLALAERYYRSGDEGLGAIPVRTRFAIVVASRVYRAIGLRLLALGGDPLVGRTVVPLFSKLVWAARAAAHFIGGLFAPPALRPHDPSLHVLLVGLPAADAPPEEKVRCTA